MKKNLSDNRGVALIVVILMVSIIVAVTIELNRATRAEIYETANLSDGIRLYYIAKSGFYGGEAMLTADENNFDALTEDWAKMELISQQSEALFREGSFIVKIGDETGRININKTIAAGSQNKPAKDVPITDPSVKGLLIRLLSLPDFRLDKDRVYEIVDSIQDWLDKDDESTGAGAESSYYNGLEKPYSAKNGLLDCIDELLMIKGMTKELYYGTEETPALRDCLTVYGDGKININTAPKLVLRALSSAISPEIAEKMDFYRRAQGNNLADVNWYRKIPGLDEININELIVPKSDYFRISATGILGKMRENLTGIIKKGSARGAVELLSWKVE